MVVGCEDRRSVVVVATSLPLARCQSEVDLDFARSLELITKMVSCAKMRDMIFAHSSICSALYVGRDEERDGRK